VDVGGLTVTLVALVAIALIFDFMNGFHDAANSIATIVSTGVLKPYQAVAWAAFFNFVAIALFEMKVAATVGKGIVSPGAVDNQVIFGALIGAIASKEFYLRFPRRLSEWVLITIGGLLMGVGIRLAFVCNVSTFFGLTPEMNLGGYLSISGIIGGAWVGSMIYKKILES